MYTRVIWGLTMCSAELVMQGLGQNLEHSVVTSDLVDMFLWELCMKRTS